MRALSRSRNWALTGTPVENSSEDLVGIFEFLAPGFLSSEMKPRRMGQLISDYVLRRTKDQVLQDMPPKLFRDASMDLTAEQRETYQLAEDEGVLRLTELGEGATIQHVFELVLRLKQICNFDPATEPAPNWSGWKPIWKRSPAAGARRSSSANGSTRSCGCARTSSGLVPWSITGASPRPSGKG